MWLNVKNKTDEVEFKFNFSRIKMDSAHFNVILQH